MRLFPFAALLVFAIVAIATAPDSRPAPIAAAHPFSFWKTSATPTPTPSSSDPSGIASLRGWFKASDYDAVADATELSAAWTDSSGFANATLVGATGNRPTVSRNSINTTMTSIASAAKPGLTRGSFTLSDNNSWTVFMVVNFTATPATESNVFAFNNGVSSGLRMGLAPANKFRLVYPNVGNFDTTGTVAINTWHYLVIRNTSGNEQVYLNGTLMAWVSQPGTQSGTTSAFNILQGYDVGGYYFQGKVAEIAVFNAAVSDADRTTKLEAYAQARYGL